MYALAGTSCRHLVGFRHFTWPAHPHHTVFLKILRSTPEFSLILYSDMHSIIRNDHTLLDIIIEEGLHRIPHVTNIGWWIEAAGVADHFPISVRRDDGRPIDAAALREYADCFKQRDDIKQRGVLTFTYIRPSVYFRVFKQGSEPPAGTYTDQFTVTALYQELRLRDPARMFEELIRAAGSRISHFYP